MRGFYLRLTVKNLFRHKRRTFLTALAIAAGIYLLIISDSLMLGAERDSAKNITDFETGPIRILSARIPAAEKDRPSLKYLIPGGSRLIKEVQTLPEVQAATPRLLFPGTLGNGLDELPLLGVGVDPGSDGAVFRIKDCLKAGKWLAPGENGIVIGGRVAELLAVNLGDQVTIRTKTKAGSFQALDLTVVGLLGVPDPIVNQGQMFLPLDVMREALGTGDAVSMVVVYPRPGHDLEAVAERLRHLSSVGFLKVQTWEVAAADFMAGLRMHSVLHSVFFFLILIVAVIGIVNTILLASLERVREIGLLKALGVKEREIVRLFAYEGIGLGLLGALIGATLGIITNLYLVKVGYDLALFMGDMAEDLGYPLASVWYGAWNWRTIAWVLVFAVVVSLAASYLPAKRASRLDPVEGLRRL